MAFTPVCITKKTRYTTSCVVWISLKFHSRDANTHSTCQVHFKSLNSQMPIINRKQNNATMWEKSIFYNTRLATYPLLSKYSWKFSSELNWMGKSSNSAQLKRKKRLKIWFRSNWQRIQYSRIFFFFRFVLILQHLNQWVSACVCLCLCSVSVRLSKHISIHILCIGFYLSQLNDNGTMFATGEVHCTKSVTEEKQSDKKDKHVPPYALSHPLPPIACSLFLFRCPIVQWMNVHSMLC